MKTQKQIIEEVLKELFDKSFLDKVRRNDAEDLICFSDLEEAMQKFSKLQREDELKFLKSLIGRPIFIQNIKDRIKELEKET